jgi:hypothetical protein
MKKLVLAIILVSLFVVDAYAWRGRRRGYTYYSYSSSFKTEIDNEKRYYDNTLSLQDIADLRAQWMAHYGVMTHGIHGYHKNCPPKPAGVLEGIGRGGEKCGTCTYGSRTCVADAERKSKSGSTFRVRFFR